MNPLSSKTLIEAGSLDKEEQDTYDVGKGILGTFLLNMLTSLITGILLGMVWQVLVISIVFQVLRSYSGGFHLKTEITCYIHSSLMILALLMAVKYVPWNPINTIISLGLSLIIVFILAPVEARNKPLNEKETKVFRSKALRRTIFFSLGAGILSLTGFSEASICITITIAAVSILLLLGHFQLTLITRKQ